MKYVIVGGLVVGRNPKLDGEWYYFETNSVHKDSCLVVEHEDVGEGYHTYSYTSDTGLFKEAEKEPIPQSITPRQARLKLLEVGLLDELEAIITTNRAWQIEWEYATEVKRDSPLIDAIASEAGLTVEQIDQMFIEASTL